MKAVLIVAHNYPPVYGAGAEPTIRLAQYLPAFGYMPVVLTTERYGSLPDDAANRVYRSADVIHRLFAPLRSRRTATVRQADQFRVATVANQSLPGRLRDMIMVPDTKIGWLPGAVRLGHALVEEYHIALVFSTSPPETDHLVAQAISERHGLPWAMDLRDGWVFEPPNGAARRGPVRGQLEAWLEGRAIRRADAILTATEPLGDDVRNRFPVKAGQVFTISNGYDAAEFAGLARRRSPDGSLLLVHTGSLGASRQGTSAQPFFQALAMFRQAHPDVPARVTFVGLGDGEEAQLARSYGLADVINIVPPVSRLGAHQHQLDADALLLITAPGQRSVATLKLFDYIGAGVPILALAHDNAAAGVVQGYGLGITARPDDPGDIVRALGDLAARLRAGESWPGFAAARRDLEWQTLARRLAEVFDHMIQP